MKKINWKDIGIRAFKTFIQGFLGALAITLPNADYSDLEVIKSLVIGAIAAGISAVMNLALVYLKKGN